MKIKVEQSGGFAGISSCTEMEVDRLPPSLEDTILDLLKSKEPQEQKGLRPPKGAADHLNYKITINDGKKDHVVECNEYEVNSKVKGLINYVQKYKKQ